MAFAAIAAGEAAVDGYQRGEAIFRALLFVLVKHGEKPVGRQVDDALPVASADIEGTGAGDELLPFSPLGGGVAFNISATLRTPLATIGPIIIAMTGSFSAIVMAV